MHAPSRLRLEPRPSRIGLALIAVGCSAATALVAALAPPWPVSVAAIAVIALAFRSGRHRCAGHDVPAIVHVGIDRSITVTDRTGRSRDGFIAPDSFVAATLATIVWRSADSKGWRRSGVILLLPDSLSADEFRRLRVLLRYGFPESATLTSATDAG